MMRPRMRIVRLKKRLDTTTLHTCTALLLDCSRYDCRDFLIGYQNQLVDDHRCC